MTDPGLRNGMIPEDNPPEFFAKHLSAYHFTRPFAKDKKVLEVGFGDGYGMVYLSEEAAEVTGIDIASPNIPLAQAKYPLKKLRFVHFDGFRIPFPDETFDVVGSYQVIEHVPENKLVDWLTEIKRVLKKDGVFCVSTLNLQNAMKPGAPYEKNFDHHKEFYAHELKELLEKVFPRVALYGLQYRLKHRVFKRLKKWGLESFSPVRRYFEKVGVDAFEVSPRDVERGVDLIALCRL